MRTDDRWRPRPIALATPSDLGLALEEIGSARKGPPCSPNSAPTVPPTARSLAISRCLSPSEARPGRSQPARSIAARSRTTPIRSKDIRTRHPPEACGGERSALATSATALCSLAISNRASFPPVHGDRRVPAVRAGPAGQDGFGLLAYPIDAAEVANGETADVVTSCPTGTFPTGGDAFALDASEADVTNQVLVSQSFRFDPLGWGATVTNNTGGVVTVGVEAACANADNVDHRKQEASTAPLATAGCCDGLGVLPFEAGPQPSCPRPTSRPGSPRSRGAAGVGDAQEAPHDRAGPAMRAYRNGAIAALGPRVRGWPVKSRRPQPSHL